MYDKQCPSCGGNCGRTRASGCMYQKPLSEFESWWEANRKQYSGSGDYKAAFDAGYNAAVKKLLST